MQGSEGPPLWSREDDVMEYSTAQLSNQAGHEQGTLSQTGGHLCREVAALAEREMTDGLASTQACVSYVTADIPSCHACVRGTGM